MTAVEAPTLLDLIRPTDPETSRDAAKKVSPGQGALIAAIRYVVITYGPQTAWEIADRVQERHGDRWCEATVRTACARAGLRKMRTTALNPRGNKCCIYDVDASYTARSTVKVVGEVL